VTPAAGDLYALPLDEFTAARNKLARDLGRDGDKEEAARVKALRKPSQPAWVVNQLVRRRKKEAKNLLRVGERLRKEQEKALGGSGRGALEKAVADEREAVQLLVGEAQRISDEDGVKLSGANLDRVRQTLHAVSLDEEVRAAFKDGELVSDHEATGIDALALMAAPRTGGGRSGKGKKGDGAAARKRLREAEAEEKRIEEELGAARRELNAAQERVKQLEGHLRRAQKATARARSSD
jgi:hypothetical protein